MDDKSARTVDAASTHANARITSLIFSEGPSLVYKIPR